MECEYDADNETPSNAADEVRATHAMLESNCHQRPKRSKMPMNERSWFRKTVVRAGQAGWAVFYVEGHRQGDSRFVNGQTNMFGGSAHGMD